MYTDVRAGVMEGQVPGGAFYGPSKKRQGVGVSEEEGEPAWALPASSLLPGGMGSFITTYPRPPEHAGSEPGWGRVCVAGRGDSNRY